MKSPCMDCPYRKLTCHDQCPEYTEYHDTLVAAREALRTADKALDLLLGNFRERKAKWERKHKC